MLKIAIGGDHAGFEYKKELIQLLSLQAHMVDCGPDSDASCDYPDHAHLVAQSVETGESDFGILICGSGNGVAITANKHKGIRAALCWNVEIASLARQHNNANVLCLPARYTSLAEAKEITLTFLSTAFEGGRHQRRVEKIDL
ncbi:MAG: ribose 5-phosphate isomerase B [Bacteroidetes bacterium]|nr:ribose 5-phosphate isomerase B [Bacteroidota bacterium]